MVPDFRDLFYFIELEVFSIALKVSFVELAIRRFYDADAHPSRRIYNALRA